MFNLNVHFSNIDNSIKPTANFWLINLLWHQPRLCTNLDDFHQEAVNSYLLKFCTQRKCQRATLVNKFSGAGQHLKALNTWCKKLSRLLLFSKMETSSSTIYLDCITRADRRISLLFNSGWAYLQ